jgi:hypothetical protein
MGYRGYIGAAKQTTDRATFDPATDFARIASAGIAKVPEPIELDLISNSHLPQVELFGNEPVAGPVVMPINVDDVFGLFLKSILGNETFLSLESGQVGSHVFTPQGAYGTPYGLSLEVSSDPDIADNVWKVTGGRVVSLEISSEPGQPVNVTTTIDAYDMVKGGTDQTPVGYGPRQRYILGHTGVVEIDASPVRMVSFACTISKQPVMGRFNLMNKLADDQLPGVYNVSGQVVLRFDSLSEVNNYLANVARQLSISWTSEIIGATQLKFALDMATVYWRGEVPKPGGTGEQMLTLPFVSKNAVDADFLTATLINTVASAY